MTEQSYEYRGLKVSTWDLLRGDTSRWADRSFYRDLIARFGQPALDVGCGTGRLLLDYLADGVDIDGVDNSPEMLALCREKAQQLGLRPSLFQQSMVALDLPRRYRTILVPSSSFQLLFEPAQATAAIRRFFEHLEPGGALVMPFMVVWREGDPREKDWALVVEKVRPEDGATVRRWARAWHDSAAQLEHTEDRYEVVRDGEILASELRRQSPAGRWYTQAQVRDLYRAVGFGDIQLLSKFQHAPASEDDTLFTAVGTRP
jgi:ubiquinone/menaquinone biosynthesis C-methylase UbiE